MTAGDMLQIAGGFSELGGLGMIVWGMSRRRRATGRPLLVGRVWARIRRAWAWLFRRKETVHLDVHSATHAQTAGSVRVMQIEVWDKRTDPEALERLKQIANRHTEEIHRLAGEIDKERQERADADRIEQSERLSDKEDSDAKIRLAAAGELTLEAWGATFLAVGIILMIAGVWIG